MAGFGPLGELRPVLDENLTRQLELMKWALKLKFEKNTAKWNSLNSKHFQNKVGLIIIMIRGV